MTIEEYIRIQKESLDNFETWWYGNVWNAELHQNDFTGWLETHKVFEIEG